MRTVQVVEYCIVERLPVGQLSNGFGQKIVSEQTALDGTLYADPFPVLRRCRHVLLPFFFPISLRRALPRFLALIRQTLFG